MRWALVPSVEFRAVPMPAGADYAQAGDVDRAAGHRRQSGALWTPAGLRADARRRAPRSSSSTRPASSNPSAWNAPLDDEESQRPAPPCSCAARRARSTASARSGRRKYRQATFGAFLTNEDNARRALDFAYRDVLAAYEAFLRQAPADRPIILAAHSQGSLHLMRLLQERIRGAPEAERIVAAYLVGWPVSETADLPALPLPACARPGPGALPPLLAELRRARRSEPGDRRLRRRAPAPAASPRAGSAMLCTNPLTGARGGAAPAGAQSRHAGPQRGLHRGRVPPRRGAGALRRCAASC